MTLGHLETRMNTAKSLDSAAEYKQALLLYAKTIADEGFRGKAEELLTELYGPVYWYVCFCIHGCHFFFNCSLGDLGVRTTVGPRPYSE